MRASSLRDFQQDLWESWRRQDLSYLSGKKQGEVWEFVDDHYYPLYGLGDVDADVVVVGAGPAWNAGEGNQFSTKRNKSWEQNDLTWTPDVDRDSFEQQEEIWRLERLEQQNKLVTTLTKLVKFSSALEIGETNGFEDPFQSLYFTNLQKDGEFKDSDLNTMSQEFWGDYLAQEIELLSPSVVLPVGRPATPKVLDIYGHEPQIKPLEAIDGETPPIVQSYHWSGLWMNLRRVDESVLPDEAAEKINPLDGTDDYWRAAAMQIDRFL